MNTINFQKNDFPLSTNVLDFMQEALLLLQKVTGLVGGNYIISGAQTVGSAVSAGFVSVNGEIMPFDGGTLQSYVRVISTETTVTINDATYTKTTKRLAFGVGSGQILWSSFRNGNDLLTKIEGKADKCLPYVGSVDYSLTGLPAEENFIITTAFSSVIFEIEYYWAGSGTSTFNIAALYPQGSIPLTRTASSEVKKEVLILPVDSLKRFRITGPATYYSNLRIKITFIGSM